MAKGNISSYVDAMIIEALIGDPSLFKKGQTSGILSAATSMIGEYFSSYMNPEDKTGSIINMLAPAGLFKLFSMFGYTKLGLLLGVGAAALHINVGGMIESILNSIKQTLSSGQKVSPAQIDSAVSSAVQEHTPQEDPDQSPASDNRVAQDLREARMVRIAIEQYDHQMLRLTKEASPVMFSYAFGRAAKGTSLIGRILGWIFKTILISGGFLLVGDEAAKLVGAPNALNHTWHAGQPSTETAAAPIPVTTQTKFKPTGAGTEAAPHPWSVQTTNDPNEIENMLVSFTKEVYAGLDGHEDWIRSSPIFQAIKNQIAWYNHTASGEPTIYIPSSYSSKKAIVDHYIDQVASNAT